MNKNLEELKKIEDKIFKTDIKKLNKKALAYMMEKIIHCFILVLEGFILTFEEFKKQINGSKEEILKLEKRIKKLGQAKTFFPMIENRHQALLNNCVDDDEAILHGREIEGVKGDGC